MPLDFPSGATTGTTYTGTNGILYTFDGVKWLGSTPQGSIIPSANNTYDLGSTSSQWRSLYVSTNTVYIGGTPLNIVEGQLRVGGNAISASTSTLVNGTWTVSLSNVGLTQFPAVSGESLFIQGSEIGSVNATIAISAADDVLLTANILGSPKQWRFGTDSNLTLPGPLRFSDASIQTTAYVSNAEQRFDVKSANFNADVNRRYGVSTTATTVTATLPASPSLGDAVFFADAGGNFAINNFTIDRNGNTIMELSTNTVITTNGDSVGLFWNGSTWRYYE
jgi:hypothetical protein